MNIFDDRMQAGKLLAERLDEYAGRTDVIVLALPRGGVPVGFEVAQALDVPLDILLVRKLGVPGHEEYAMGAIASGGMRVVNQDAVDMLGISDATLDAATQHEMQEITRREKLYRGDKPPPDLHGRTVIVVDDGLATGSTMLAAVRALRDSAAARVVVAVPVGAVETCERLRSEADEVICLRMPEPFRAVGLWYREFPQLADQEVIDLLARADERAATSKLAGAQHRRHEGDQRGAIDA